MPKPLSLGDAYALGYGDGSQLANSREDWVRGMKVECPICKQVKDRRGRIKAIIDAQHAAKTYTEPEPGDLSK